MEEKSFAFKKPKEYTPNQKKFAWVVIFTILIFLGSAVYLFVVAGEKHLAGKVLNLGIVVWGLEIFVIGKFIK